MGIAFQRAPHEFFALKPSLSPVVGTGSAQNGAAVDRMGHLSAIGILTWSTSGGVTGGTITCRFQDSSNGSSGWSDFGDVVTVTIPAGPNASGVAEVPADLGAAARYIRLVVVSDPSGGTPASIVSAAVLLGGADTRAV